MGYALFEFAGMACVIVVAGIFLTRSSDQIAEITRMGRLLIGSILLAGATSLPELTVDLSAVRKGMADLATGDLLGSSLMNLLILAVLDLIYYRAGKMLTRESAAHALSATLSMALTGLVGLAIVTAPKLTERSFLNIGLWSWAILGAYLLGVRMVFLDQRISARAAPESGEGESADSIEKHSLKDFWKPASIFVAAATVILLVGPRLADAAGRIAELSGLGKTFVGTTLVAFCTSLPELTASLTALRMKAHDLVIGNVFGSNAFNMVLFVALDGVQAGPFFAHLSPAHAVTCLAAILATSTAVLGQLYHVERRYRLLEPDAMLMIGILVGAMYVVYLFSAE